MRRCLWTFVLLLLTGIVCAAAVPPVDVPETNYNEVDTPVNQAPPVALGIRFVRPAPIVKTVPRVVLQARWNPEFPVDELLSPPLSARSDAHLVRDLLCTLLI